MSLLPLPSSLAAIRPANPRSPGKWALKRREPIFSTHHALRKRSQLVLGCGMDKLLTDSAEIKPTGKHRFIAALVCASASLLHTKWKSLLPVITKCKNTKHVYNIPQWLVRRPSTANQDTLIKQLLNVWNKFCWTQQNTNKWESINWNKHISWYA